MDVIEQLNQICNEIDNRGISVEGIALMDKEANLLYERRWRQDYPRDVYSNAKSFTSAAVGMAIHDGVLRLSDKPYSFFGEYCCLTDKSYIQELTLQNLLTMSSGHQNTLLNYFKVRQGIGVDNYVEYLMNQPISYKPGSKFLYSTGDSILAGAMVEKAVGSSLLKYMYNRLFKNLKMEFPTWETDLVGHCCGGSGLLLKLSDMMKLGVLYLNNGCMKGVQYFDENWVKESTSIRFNIKKDEDTWSHGYGYFWRIFPDEQTYRATGVFGQETIVIPKINLVIGIQCAEGTNFNDVKLLFNEYIFRELDII